MLNGTDRCQYKPLQYFTRENVRKYHKGGCISVPDSIAVFSFALNPNDTSPSGTCNFSNIDLIQIHRNQTLPTDTLLKKVNVYAINYNILRFVNDVISFESGDISLSELEKFRPTFKTSLISTAVIESVLKSLNNDNKTINVKI